MGNVQAPNPLSDFFFGLFFFFDDRLPRSSDVKADVLKLSESDIVPREGPKPPFLLSSSSCRESNHEEIDKYPTPSVSTDNATTARENITPITGSSGAGALASTIATASSDKACTFPLLAGQPLRLDTQCAVDNAVPVLLYLSEC